MADLSEPLHAQLDHADDRVRLSKWLPPQSGGVPRIRLESKWYSVLWLVPIGFIFLVGGIALCLELRRLSAVQNFIAKYPGQDSLPIQYFGFPAWLRWQHFFNLFLMLFIIRAGLQILADHPRLYWNPHCTPGTEWFRFQHDVPQGRIWTAKDDSVTLPGWLGIPGIRHSIGLARWWHFSCDLLSVLNGVLFYRMLFSTHLRQRIVPRTWAVFPNVLSTAISVPDTVVITKTMNSTAIACRSEASR